MLLALDAGNTNITIGAFSGAKLAGRWRLRTIREQTADEWGVLMRNLFSLLWKMVASSAAALGMVTMARKDRKPRPQQSPDRGVASATAPRPASAGGTQPAHGAALKIAEPRAPGAEPRAPGTPVRVFVRE